MRNQDPGLFGTNRMESMFFLVMRRMRLPLLLLILAYAVAILGLVLIPGQDAEGNPWRMGFFHAFYFVSYMATTIGFGEIPYAFTDAQRMWVTFSIYLTVVVWIYSIGTLISLVQDPAFRQALIEIRFTERVRRLRQEFHLICGYGETGRELVRALTEQGRQVVVIEREELRVNQLKMENLPLSVPALCGDAARPLQLLEAGLKHPLCRSVVALTNVNEINLKVAITAKLLHPDIHVICRADSHDVEANMASFGTEHIIDPFDTFALHLATAFQSPCLHLLREWLTARRDQPLLSDPIYPPRKGVWIICGYGRFGKAVHDRLRREGVEVVVVEATPERTGAPRKGVIRGWGTEANTLLEAGIMQAVGIVAGTNDDVNNLSIILTARELRPNLFVVLRQNFDENQSIVEAVHADIVMNPNAIIANRIRLLLITPLLSQFLSLALHQDEEWACTLLSRVIGLVETEPPEIWEVAFEPEDTHAVCIMLKQGGVVRLDHLVRDPRNREGYLPCIPLLLIRGTNRTLLPDYATPLSKNDRLLFCGSPGGRSRMEWSLQNQHALSYVITGESRPQGWIWRALRRRQRR